MRLYPHQRAMLRYAIQRKAWAFYVEQRLGKTLPTIRALRYHAGRAPWLVVAPYSALRSWQTALDGEDVPYTWPQGSIASRSQDILNEGRACVAVLVNWQSVAELLPTLLRVQWGAVVVDESRLMANPQANVTKALLRLGMSTAVRVLLSGAPATEGPQEYYTQMRFLGEAWGGHTFWSWRERWFRTSPERQQEWTCTVAGEREVARVVGRYAYSLRRADTAYALPATVREEWSELGDIPAAVQRQYREAEDSFVWRDDNAVDMTSFVGQSRVWLRSCCSGVKIGPAFGTGGCWLHTERLRRLQALLSGEYRDEPVVLWCEHVAEVSALHAALDHERRRAWCVMGSVPQSMRAERIEGWERSGNGILISQSAALARGEDLSAARTVVWWSLPYSLDVFLQAQERTRRIGVHDSTHSVVLLQAGTVEEDLWEALRTKNADACSWWKLIEAARKRGEA